MTAFAASHTDWDEAAARSRRREFERNACWYVAIGVLTTAAQAVLFLTLRPVFGPYPANLLAIAVTTLANSEFHRLVTFAGAPSRPARRHLQSLITFGFYSSYGSAVLLLLNILATNPSPAMETVALTGASVLGGTIRFFVLKLWVFNRRH